MIIIYNQIHILDVSVYNKFKINYKNYYNKSKQQIINGEKMYIHT